RRERAAGELLVVEQAVEQGAEPLGAALAGRVVRRRLPEDAVDLLVLPFEERARALLRRRGGCGEEERQGGRDEGGGASGHEILVVRDPASTGRRAEHLACGAGGRITRRAAPSARPPPGRSSAPGSKARRSDRGSP